ncbi:MAG: protein kinase, partial [Planctomycetota bacterium]
MATPSFHTRTSITVNQSSSKSANTHMGRRVALKVLPFAVVLDQRQLQRFKNEAQAAAQLHHTNILPVYGVGCERGVHFYAMQFVDGPTLADVIRELRNVSGVNNDSEPQAPARGSSAEGGSSSQSAISERSGDPPVADRNPK